MSGVRCYNPSCGEEGTCGIADHDLRMCPEAVESALSAGIPHDVVMGNAKFNEPKPMTQEDCVAHFAWERGNGPDPHE